MGQVFQGLTGFARDVVSVRQSFGDNNLNGDCLLCRLCFVLRYSSVVASL